MDNEEAQIPGEPSLKRRLQSIDDLDFERFIADLWECQGWNTEVEQETGDAGVDIRARKQTPYQEKILIQAKRYSEPNLVSGPSVQQYGSLKYQEENVDKVLIITTSGFTSPAVERAHDLNVKLINGDELADLIKELDAIDIVQKYTGQVSPQVFEETSEIKTDTSTQPETNKKPEMGTQPEMSTKTETDADGSTDSGFLPLTSSYIRDGILVFIYFVAFAVMPEAIGLITVGIIFLVASLVLFAVSHNIG